MSKPKKFIVLLREDWAGKITNCPWFYPYTEKGYKAAIHCQETLLKLFPEKVYNMKAYDFNKGAETEIPITF